MFCMLGAHGRQGGRRHQKYTNMETKDKGRRGDTAVAATKSSPKGRRKTNSGNRVAAVEQPSEKGDKLGIQGGCSQEQLKKEIKEGEKLARQGSSCIKKEDRLGSFKVAAEDLRPTGDFGNQQPRQWEVGTPLPFSYLGKEK